MTQPADYLATKSILKGTYLKNCHEYPSKQFSIQPCFQNVEEKLLRAGCFQSTLHQVHTESDSSNANEFRGLRLINPQKLFVTFFLKLNDTSVSIQIVSFYTQRIKNPPVLSQECAFQDVQKLRSRIDENMR